jgi:cobyrinic acid a,c-diamide synthase
VIREAIAEANGPPVLGAMPRWDADAGLVPGRHLGLVTPAEFGSEAALRQRLLDLGQSYLDVDALLAVASSATPLEVPRVPTPDRTSANVRIGYFDDSVFTFYYPENLEALVACGAELVPVSSLSDSVLPNLDGLYIGGGFPETHAEQLAANPSLMRSVREAAHAGLPVFAECGGLIFLARSLTWREQRYPMAGVFPYDVALQERPVGHGYTRVEVDRANPFFAAGTPICGHEFHYSKLVSDVRPEETCMRVARGVGVGNGRDGLMFNQVVACYTHIHADAVRGWAPALVASAQAYARSQAAGTRSNDNRGTTRTCHAMGAWGIAQ